VKLAMRSETGVFIEDKYQPGLDEKSGCVDAL